MGQIKNYMLKLQEQCSDELFGQEAIEWAVLNEHIKLTYNLDADVSNVMAILCTADLDAVFSVNRRYAIRTETISVSRTGRKMNQTG